MSLSTVLPITQAAETFIVGADLEILFKYRKVEAMMWLKACPRCKWGDMYRDEDDLRHCLQCGFIQGSRLGAAADVKLARLLGEDTAVRAGRLSRVAV